MLEKPRNAAMGDYACTLAMALARPLKKPPPQIAADILNSVQANLPAFVEVAEVRGGYINIRIKNAAKTGVIADILNSITGDDKDGILTCLGYGRGTPKDEPLLLEYVSANPTGPLHVGHGRAAAYGDSLANILVFAGYPVWREYYVNDSGRQASILAASVWMRYFIEQNASDDAMPKGAYQGAYLRDFFADLDSYLQKATPPPPDLSEQLNQLDDNASADALCAAMRRAFVTKNGQADDKTAADFIAAAAAAVLLRIQNDLAMLGVSPFDCWFSEQHLYDNDKLAAAINTLRQQNAENIYEKDGALWFRSSAAGDDKDRVLRRANGKFTYFTADIAYHHNKLSAARLSKSKKPLRLVNILGADHHGYVPRLKAAIVALGYEPAQMETQLIQFVSLINSGQRIKMSTRGDSFVPLSLLVEEIGRDAARFFYVSRKNDQHFDFDMQLAAEKSSKNPVFYLQYAHARAAGVFRKWGDNKSTLAAADCTPLAHNPSALALCDKLAEFPAIAQSAAATRAVHVVANYLQELAAAMHHYYEKTRILDSDNGKANTDMLAKLALLEAARLVLGGGLSLLGVRAPEQM